MSKVHNGLKLAYNDIISQQNIWSRVEYEISPYYSKHWSRVSSPSPETISCLTLTDVIFIIYDFFGSSKSISKSQL